MSDSLEELEMDQQFQNEQAIETAELAKTKKVYVYGVHEDTVGIASTLEVAQALQEKEIPERYSRPIKWNHSDAYGDSWETTPWRWITAYDVIETAEF